MSNDVFQILILLKIRQKKVIIWSPNIGIQFVGFQKLWFGDTGFKTGSMVDAWFSSLYWNQTFPSYTDKYGGKFNMNE